MLFWLKTIFCSTQILDVNLLLDLENTSDILKKLCENEETQQKNQEPTKIGDKNFYESSSISNILDDFTDFIDKCFDNGYNNVDYNLSTKMFLMTLESNFMAQSSISNQYITKKDDKQFFTIKQSGMMQRNILAEMNFSKKPLIYYYIHLKMIYYKNNK